MSFYEENMGGDRRCQQRPLRKQGDLRAQFDARGLERLADEFDSDFFKTRPHTVSLRKIGHKAPSDEENC